MSDGSASFAFLVATSATRALFLLDIPVRVNEVSVIRIRT